MIEEVTTYRTPDGPTFNTREAAHKHAESWARQAALEKWRDKHLIYFNNDRWDILTILTDPDAQKELLDILVPAPEPPTEHRWPPGWRVEGRRVYAPGRGGNHDYHGFRWGADLVRWYAHGGGLTAEVTVAEAKARAWAEYRETT